MAHKSFLSISLLLLLATSCTPTAARRTPPTEAPVTRTAAPTWTPPPPSATSTPSPGETPTASPLPTVESLKARVTADLLSCRYGPGAEYLYLYALRKDANIRLIGRADGNHWVWVDGRNKCWVNAKFLEIAGDKMSLPIVYPGIARLPLSPYYPPTTVLKVRREGNVVAVFWLEVALRAGDEEDEFMQHYIVEVWRCEGGEIRFEPLATNDLSITFVDEPGCTQPSHGRIFVQEKHGFAGPTEIPWPPHEATQPAPSQSGGD